MMRVPYTFRGAIAPVFTPFNADRSINVSLIPRYAQYLAEKGVNGVLVNGTTGEGTSLSVVERKQVAEVWANAVKKTNQHLMVQVGGAPLPDVLELAKHAESIKVDSILCLPELYFKPTTVQLLLDYLKIVGEAAPNTPLFYYHIPMFTNVNIHMGTFLDSVSTNLPTLRGIKFTSNNLEEFRHAVRAGNKKFTIFLGNDQLICAACSLGMDSFIATSVNIFPDLTLKILKDWYDGNYLKAMEGQEHLSKAVITISNYGNWVETMKTAINALTDVKVGPTRAPLKPLSPVFEENMIKELKSLGYETLP